MYQELMPSLSELNRHWHDYKQQQPKARLVEVAKALNRREAELVAAQCGVRSTRLRPDWSELLPRLGELGQVMVLTRNEHAVIEKVGYYEPVQIHGDMGLVVNAAIDLRLFLRQWYYVWAVDIPRGDRLLQSLQFFDAQGRAVQKIFLREAPSQAAFDQLIRDFYEPAPFVPEDLVSLGAADRQATVPAHVDAGELADIWRQMSDVHQFHALLHRFQLTREQAFQLVPEDLARPVPVSALRQILKAARDRRCPVMIFVGNQGAIQIHSGAVECLKVVGPWFNIIDPHFNLHVREERLARAWVVRKPTEDGWVTSLELYGDEGTQVLQLFGVRKNGEPESPRWRALINTLDQRP
jgi:putative hemin transport protein